MNLSSAPSSNFYHFEELVNNLGSLFADRAAHFDANCEFVQKNYEELKEAKLFSAAIPVELGGGGLSYPELCAIVRGLGQYCGSTALAFAMHSHPIALNIFKHLHADEKAAGTLAKIAANELIIAGTGANDWLSSNGQCQAVEGGYVVSAHKRFVSGSSGADVLVSSVNFINGDAEEVLHFSLPIRSEGIRVQNNWRTLGMRGTASNDVVLENVFLPEFAVVARRPAGEWHKVWDIILPIAMPIIVSAYMGLAEKAYELALESYRKKGSADPSIGALYNDLTIAQISLSDMIRHNNEYQFTPSLNLSHQILARKTIATKSIKSVVEKAMVLIGGEGFFQGHPMERIFRDVQAMHFHPLPEEKQHRLVSEYLLP